MQPVFQQDVVGKAVDGASDTNYNSGQVLSLLSGSRFVILAGLQEILQD